ncbi:D-glucuronyl C5-epimerase family protein [Nitratireductor rhodophyticola]|uniref:D-glucuronyl C5-epimerase family protein n=1 Tax=Nitratireductor rhodophyticola TaxID=2854036 RepID=UPI0030085766
MNKKILAVISISAVLALSAGAVLVKVFHWSQAVTRNQATLIKSLAEEGRASGSLATSFRWQPDIGTVKVGDFRVHTKNYDINEDPGKVLAIGVGRSPKNWKPDIGRGLDAAIPLPWPEKYVEEYKQPFNFWSFFRNVQQLCAHFDETGSEETRAILKALYDRLLEYSELRDGQRFGLYKFKQGYRSNSIPVEWPWTSAYASGAALIGLSNMWECAKIDGALDTAHEFLAALSNPIDPREGRPQFWVSFVDDRGYLWFEEKPLDRIEQPRILNGHIRTLVGLYEYYARTESEEALKLLRAGIRTIEEYAPYYRVPGKINAYDMLQPYNDDYGPKRTIGQQDILYRMTNEPVFAIYRDVFELDMRDEIAAGK